MPKFLTHYWRNDTWDAERALDELRLNHTAGNEFKKRGVRPNDFVYVITVIRGSLYLLGRTQVRGIYSKAQAKRILQTNTVWNAGEHVIEKPGTGTRQRFDLAVPASTVRKLHQNWA